MGEKKIDTSFFDKAAMFAIEAHSGVERRGKDFPYVITDFGDNLEYFYVNYRDETSVDYLKCDFFRV